VNAGSSYRNPTGRTEPKTITARPTFRSQHDHFRRRGFPLARVDRDGFQRREDGAEGDPHVGLADPPVVVGDADDARIHHERRLEHHGPLRGAALQQVHRHQCTEEEGDGAAGGEDHVGGAEWILPVEQGLETSTTDSAGR